MDGQIDDGKGQRQFDFSHEPPVAQLLSASEQFSDLFAVVLCVFYALLVCLLLTIARLAGLVTSS